MPVPNPTEDELVATLRHTDVPTVIVEGKVDILIYRWMEGRVGSQKANVLPAGGRETLLAVYERRNEFTHLPVAFVADKDLWLFSGIPSEYPGIIWTRGYSIENDLYADANLENLLDVREASGHRQVLDLIIEWFAFEVEEYLAGRDAYVNMHCDRVVPEGATEMDEGFCTFRGFRSPDEQLHQVIKDEYQFKLRGKSLFEVLVRFLSASNRDVKHSKYSLYEIAIKLTPSHELMHRLIKEIDRTIAEHTPASR